MTDSLDAFIAGLPKAELHLHIEGSLEPEMLMALARRNDVEIPFRTVEEVRAAYQFTQLQDFLDIYYQGAGVLLNEEDFRDLALAYFARAHADTIRHAEIFFDPQTHTARGLPFAVAIEGLLAGMEEAEAKYGITSKLILCFLRHLDEEDGFATLRAAEPWLDRVEGVGLDSSELGHPPEKFARLFAAAGERGLKRVAHAGEEGPPAYVHGALDVLKVDRIDHGNRAMEEQPLVARLAREAMTLTVCPLSNLKLCVVKDLKHHPLPEMLRQGLRATINSDDPAYFGGYVNDNFRAMAAAGVLGAEQIATLARNSFLGSFLPNEAVARHLAAIDSYIGGDLTMQAWLDRYFGLTEKGVTIQGEALAGLTTFLSMSYIVLVNPAILSQAGLPIVAVAAATCASAAFASILMGLVANYPLALAPGMGLNAYFTFTVVKGMGVDWHVALGCVFLSGIAFLLMTFVGVRQLIVNSIPRPIYSAVAGGIGLFIAFIGLKEAGIVVSSPATFVTLGDLHSATPLLALFGLALIAILNIWHIRGAVVIGILATTALGWLTGQAHYLPESYDMAQLTETAFKLDIPGALHLGGNGFGILEIVFVFLFVDLFDNVGTLVGVTKEAGLIKPDGTIPRLNRILLADSIATIFGSFMGTSTVTSYVESATGVAAGGRTGLTAVVTGLLFLLALFFAPYAQIIPAAATAPALILVGGLMMAPLAEIEWKDPTVALPCFLTLVGIPLTFSIANGLAFGLTAYALLKLISGRATKSDAMLFVLATLFVVRFAYLAG